MGGPDDNANHPLSGQQTDNLMSRDGVNTLPQLNCINQLRGEDYVAILLLAYYCVHVRVWGGHIHHWPEDSGR